MFEIILRRHISIRVSLRFNSVHSRPNNPLGLAMKSVCIKTCDQMPVCSKIIHTCMHTCTEKCSKGSWSANAQHGKSTLFACEHIYELLYLRVLMYTQIHMSSKRTWTCCCMCKNFSCCDFSSCLHTYCSHSRGRYRRWLRATKRGKYRSKSLGVVVRRPKKVTHRYTSDQCGKAYTCSSLLLNDSSISVLDKAPRLVSICICHLYVPFVFAICICHLLHTNKPAFACSESSRHGHHGKAISMKTRNKCAWPCGSWTITDKA